MAAAFVSALAPLVPALSPASGPSATPAAPADTRFHFPQPGCHTLDAAAATLAAGSLLASKARRRSFRLPRGATATEQPPAAVTAVVEEPVQEADVEAILKPKAIPFLPEPAYRQFVRNVPGDFGFDPLGLAGESREEYIWKCEAELKHGRLAMLGGLGFALPELLHDRIAETVGMPNLMADYGCTPTLLNGGLSEPVLAGSLGVVTALVAFVDIAIPRNKGLPGYYGWDPLSLGSKIEFSDFARGLLSANGTEWVAEAEVKHGRVAMVAVTYIAILEALTQEPIWPSL